MNVATLLIIMVLALLVFLAVRYIVRNGVSCAEGCSGSCGTCSSGCASASGKKKNRAGSEYYQAIDQYFTGKKNGVKHV